MDHETHRQATFPYQPGSWRNAQGTLTRDERVFAWHNQSHTPPGIRERSLILELLGAINYKLVRGKRVYIEAGGVVYKTLYGGYWRSVFTGIEHYLVRCEQVSGSRWIEEAGRDDVIDLEIGHSHDGWTASGHSLWFMLSQD
jgi:hypothetical protein